VLTGIYLKRNVPFTDGKELIPVVYRIMYRVFQRTLWWGERGGAGRKKVKNKRKNVNMYCSAIV
jgi:hypothetical protein